MKLTENFQEVISDGILYQKSKDLQTTNQLSWKSFKVKLWPKPNMQNSPYRKLLSLEYQRNWLALYFHSDWRNALRLQKLSKKSSLKKTRPSYGQKFVCSGNPEQNIWNRVKKSNKIGQGLKRFIPNFACFFWEVLSKFSFCKEDNFLSLSTTREASIRIKFVILDIKLLY